MLKELEKNIDISCLKEKEHNELELIGLRNITKDDLYDTLYESVYHLGFEFMIQDKMDELIVDVLENIPKHLIYDNQQYIGDVITDLIGEDYKISELDAHIEEFTGLLDNYITHHSTSSNKCLAVNVKLHSLRYEEEYVKEYYKKQIEKDIKDEEDRKMVLEEVYISVNANNLSKEMHSIFNLLVYDWWEQTEIILKQEVENFEELFSAGRMDGWALLEFDKNYPNILYELKEKYYDNYLSGFTLNEIDAAIEYVKKDIRNIRKAVKIVEDRKNTFENNFEKIFVESFDYDYFL